MGSGLRGILAGMLAAAVLLLAGCATAESRDEESVSLEPVKPTEEITITGATVGPEGRTLRPIAFTVRAPWMDGPLLMRFPETVHSSLGLHFIDHHRPDMPPVSEIDSLPRWQRDQESGALSYSYSRPEGVSFSGRVVARGDEVHLRFRVKNNTDRPLEGVGAQQCLTLSPCDQFAERNHVKTTYTWMNGDFTALTATTPTPEKMKRPPWLLMYTEAADYSGPRAHQDGWWVVDQNCTYPVIARRSSGGRHLLGIWWQGSQGIMTNSTIPCMHSRINPRTIPPGGEATWHGRIYLLPADPDLLLRRYREDRKELRKTE